MNTVITHEILVPHIDAFIELNPQFESGSLEMFAENIGHRINNIKGRPLIGGNKSVTVTTNKEAAFFAYIINDAGFPVFVGLERNENNHYHLTTINTQTLQTFSGGGAGLLNHFEFNAEFKALLKFVEGYDQKLDFINGEPQPEGLEKIHLITKNSNIKFFGKRISESNTEHCYEAHFNGQAHKKMTITHNIEKNTTSINF